MKRKNVFFALLTGLFFVSVSALATDIPSKAKGNEMPENVKTIIDNSCFGCHNTDSRNEDAKKDLDFNTLGELTKMQQIKAYKEIVEILEKQEMPPKKFLERFPEKNISDEDRAVLIDWAKKEAEAVVKEN